jgi:hypothetical protein
VPSWASVSVLLCKPLTQTSVVEMPHVSPAKQAAYFCLIPVGFSTGELSSCTRI